MSVKIMSRVWEDAPYEESYLLILLAMADFADDEGYCWPDVSSVAYKSRTSPRTVKRATAQFVEDGWLEREAYREAGKFQSNNYRVTPPSVNRGSPGVTTAAHGEASHRGPKLATTVGLHARAPERPVNEPSDGAHERAHEFSDEEQNHHSHPPLNRTEVTPSPKPPPQPRTAKQRAKSKQHQTGRAHPTPSPISAATPSPPLSKRDQTALYMEEQLARLDDI